MRLGRYLVRECIGHGGMGEVYEAMDTELDRSVAIKFLPERFLRDETAVNRLVAEAKTSSALNHPNLVTIHELLRQEGVLAIVMERIEGATLRSHLGGVLPLGEFVPLARQIAAGLAAAHSRGIIHRDLKPENIMIRADGYVKILDFGLASLAMTAEPAFSGTLRYMSPEQRRSGTLTPASDIYSLGIVFLEMLTGSPDPAMAGKLGRRVPRSISQHLTRMLSDRPEERPAAADVERLLRPDAASPRRKWLAPAAVAIVLAGVALAAWRIPRDAPPPVPQVSPQPLTTFTGQELGVSFSPDGDSIVFSWDGERGDNFDIYQMSLRERVPRRLTTNPAADLHPAWSPDGRTIAFHRGDAGGRGVVYLVPAGGGQERAVGDVNLLHSMRRVLDWSPDSRWLALHDSPRQEQSALFLLSVQTGERRQLTWPALAERHASPAFSPDGRRIVLVRDFGGVMDLALLSLTADLRPASAPEPVRIAGFNREACTNPRWSHDGKSVLFTFDRGGALHLWQLPVPRSPAETVTPTPVPMGEGAEFAALSNDGQRMAFTRFSENLNLWRIAIPAGTQAQPPRQLLSSTRTERFADVSADNRIAFESDRSGATEIWVSDNSMANARPITRFQGGTGSPRWSPDGEWITFDTRADDQPEIYVVHVPKDNHAISAPRRLTNHPAQDKLPSWSADGRWIYFNSDRSGKTQVWRASVDGGEATAISPADARAPVASADGEWVFYSRGSREHSNIWRVPAAGGAESLVVKDVYDRSIAAARHGLWFLRRDARQRTALYFLDLRSGAERLVTELGEHVQPGLTVSRDGAFALITRADEGTRDLMLVDGKSSRR